MGEFNALIGSSFHNAFWLHDFRNFILMILILRFISYLTCDPKRDSLIYIVLFQNYLCEIDIKSYEV
jgi:hypothetical protein